MPKIVRFRDPETEHAHRHFRREAVSVPKDIDGYALVWYRRCHDKTIDVMATYSCRDPFDVWGMPSLASEALRNKLIGKGD